MSPRPDRSGPPPLTQGQALLILLAGLVFGVLGGLVVWYADVPAWFRVLVPLLPVVTAMLLVRSSWRGD